MCAGGDNCSHAGRSSWLPSLQFPLENDVDAPWFPDSISKENEGPDAFTRTYNPDALPHLSLATRRTLRTSPPDSSASFSTPSPSMAVSTEGDRAALPE